MYYNLGCHATLKSVKYLEKYTNIYQICLNDPKKFVYDFSELDEEAGKWGDYIKKGIVVCHGPYNTNIICNNKNLSHSFFSLSQTLKVCVKNKIKYLIVHPGVLSYIDKRSESFAVKHTQNFIERFLLSFNKVDILLENLSCLRSLKLDVLYEIVKDYPNVGLCLDTNHAFGHGESLETIVKYLNSDKTKVIHLNAVPKDLKFGSGLDNHSRTCFSQSVGITPQALKDIAFSRPEKIKIMEQYSKFSEKSFKFLNGDLDEFPTVV
jgi:endonuclease IV